MKTNSCVSDVVSSSTEAPLGAVAFLVLFALYMVGFSFNPTPPHLKKSFDDTDIVACVSEGYEQGYKGVILDFVD